MISGIASRIWIVIVGCVLIFGTIDTSWATEVYRSAVSPEHANGIVAYIIKKVADKIGIQVEMKRAPFARRLKWMESGEIDFMGGLLKRPRREAYIYFVSPPYVNENRKVFYVRKGEEMRIRAYDDLYKLTIGTKIHSRYFPRFDQDPGLHKDAVSKVEQNFRKLLAGRIDAVIYSNRSGHAKLLEMGIADKVGVAPFAYLKSNPVYIGISQRSPLMQKKAKFESAVRQMVESGDMEAIIKSFYER